MSALSKTIDELVTANHILGFEGVVDAFGHVSARHPENPNRFLLSRARTPQCVEAGDIMEFTLDGQPVDARGRTPYSERFIHACLYQARPELRSIVHSHSLHTIPFGVGGEKLRPIVHNCAPIGKVVPIWDPREKFGSTDLMVTNVELGRDLARVVGNSPTALMRGHGSVAVGRSLRRAVFVAMKVQEAAKVQKDVAGFKDVVFLSSGEIDTMMKTMDAYDDRPLLGIDRAWEYWCFRAGVPSGL